MFQCRGAVQRKGQLQGMKLPAAGVVIGVGAAFGLSRFMATLLFGVTTRDPLVFAGVPVLLVHPQHSRAPAEAA